MSPTVANNYAPTPPAAGAANPAQTLHSPPITIVLTVVLLIFFLLGFFSIYFCRCIMGALSHTWNLRRTSSGRLAGGGSASAAPANSGLDPALIKALPTFLYSSVKDARREKYGLECAICLAEFRDDSLLRLLTVCFHVFHQECVDLWLESHKTCPVCRRDLDSPPNPNIPAKSSPENPPLPAATPPPPPANDIAVIDVKDDEDGDSDEDVVRRRFRQYQRENDRSARVRVCNTDKRAAAAGGGGGGERFTRSHSTGHSIAKVGLGEELLDDRDHDEDRYTLKLPDHVRMRILRARHWTASCETYGDFERQRLFTVATSTAALDDSSSGVLGDVSGSVGSNN